MGRVGDDVMVEAPCQDLKLSTGTPEHEEKSQFAGGEVEQPCEEE